MRPRGRGSLSEGAPHMLGRWHRLVAQDGLEPPLRPFLAARGGWERAGAQVHEGDSALPSAAVPGHIHRPAAAQQDGRETARHRRRDRGRREYLEMVARSRPGIRRGRTLRRRAFRRERRRSWRRRRYPGRGRVRKQFLFPAAGQRGRDGGDQAVDQSGCHGFPTVHVYEAAALEPRAGRELVDHQPFLRPVLQ